MLKAEVNKMKKTKAIIISALVAVFAFSLVAGANAMPFMNWKDNRGIGNAMSNSHRFVTQQSFVRFDGSITKSGTTNVTGTIEAQSRTIILNNTNSKTGSIATAIWTTNLTRPISAYRAKENFTYTYYTANLVVANVSSLNETGYSFFLNGTWNVFKITENLTIRTDSSGNFNGFSRNQSAIKVENLSVGNLTIPTGSTTFTLDIQGIDNLTGVVHFQRMTTKMFNPFIVSNDGSSTTVTKADVATVVSSYGSSPGWGNYDQRMDYNFNGKIDVTDLATAAANMNS
jgi:hypothetical protein